jgi:hypothetical protein
MTLTSPLDELSADRSTQPDSVSTSGVAPGTKKAYSRPELFVHGNLRSLTFGGSPGNGESGAGFATSNIETWP